MIRVRVGVVRSHGQAGIEQQHAPLRPGCEEASLVGWRDEVGIIIFEAHVHVSERRRGDRGRPDGEGEPVGLVDVVVGILAENHHANRAEGGEAGPKKNRKKIRNVKE